MHSICYTYHHTTYPTDIPFYSGGIPFFSGWWLLFWLDTLGIRWPPVDHTILWFTFISTIHLSCSVCWFLPDYRFIHWKYTTTTISKRLPLSRYLHLLLVPTIHWPFRPGLFYVRDSDSPLQFRPIPPFSHSTIHLHVLISVHSRYW